MFQPVVVMGGNGRMRLTSHRLTGRGGLAVMLLAGMLLAAGCSSAGSGAHASSSSAAGVPTSSGAGAATPASSVPGASQVLAGSSLCQLLTKINTAAAKAANPADGLAVLRQYRPQLDAVAAAAPAAARADLAVLTDATSTVLSSGNLDALAADPVVTAGAHLLTLCGQSTAPSANPTKN
jgi:hypothetical protein